MKRISLELQRLLVRRRKKIPRNFLCPRFSSLVLFQLSCLLGTRLVPLRNATKLNGSFQRNLELIRAASTANPWESSKLRFLIKLAAYLNRSLSPLPALAFEMEPFIYCATASLLINLFLSLSFQKSFPGRFYKCRRVAASCQTRKKNILLRFVIYSRGAMKILWN